MSGAEPWTASNMAADKATGQVGNDVAVEIRRDQYVEVFRMHDQLHACVIDDLVVAFDLRIVLGDFLEDRKEEAVAELHDIGLVDAGDLLAAVGYGVVEGGLDDAAAGLAGDDLDGMHFIVADFFFYAGIEVFRVFTEGDQVDVGEGRDHSCVRFCRADIGEEIVFLAQHDVDGTETATNRRSNRRFQQDACLFKGSKGLIRYEGAVLFVFGSADIVDFIFKGGLGGLQDVDDDVGDFWADAVAFKYSDCFHIIDPP